MRSLRDGLRAARSEQDDTIHIWNANGETRTIHDIHDICAYTTKDVTTRKMIVGMQFREEFFPRDTRGGPASQ